MVAGYVLQNAKEGLKTCLKAMMAYQRPHLDTPEGLSLRGVLLVGADMEEEEPKGKKLADDLDGARKAVLSALGGNKEAAAQIEKKLEQEIRSELGEGHGPE